MPPESHLTIETIKCVRKNEMTADEIRLEGFWSTKDGEISGHFAKDFVFRDESESQPTGVNVSLRDFTSDRILYLLLSEVDLPPIDPDDPIGAIAIFASGAIAVYNGDFRKPMLPKSYAARLGRVTSIALDAGSDGHYAMGLRFGEPEP